jgi:hypothetical protein
MIRRILVVNAISITIIISSWLLSGIWWSLWLADGWSVTPSVLSPILGLDGEDAYDAKYIELFIIVMLFEIFATFTIYRIIKEIRTKIRDK